jgi:hypothetical protein
MIQYKKRRRYKYTLCADYQYRTQLGSIGPISTPFISLYSDGMLKINKGYAWDGPSGPTFDTSSFMKASLVHDAFYQLMREGHIAQEHREYADKVLHEICISSGMSKIRAWWVYHAVRICGSSSAKPGLLEAP